MASEDVKPKDVGEAGGLRGGESTPVEFEPKAFAVSLLEAARIEVESGALAPERVLEWIAERRARSAVDDPFADRWIQLPSEWVDVQPPAQRWLLRVGDSDTANKTSKGVLPFGKVSMLTAAGGVGKTTVLTQLAISVATGRDWLGTYRVAEPGCVVLALGEDEAADARRRLFYAAQTMRLSESERRTLQERLVLLPLAGRPVPLTENDGRGNISTTPTLAMLRKRLERAPDGKGWALLILDPLSRWAGSGTETDNTAATRFIQAVETLTTAQGNPAVMLSHHVSQAAKTSGNLESEAARGVSALVDGVRLLLTMASPAAKDKETPEQSHKRKRFVTITGAKTNVGTYPPPIDLARGDEGILYPLNAMDKAELSEIRRAKKGTEDTNAEAGAKGAKPDGPVKLEVDL